MLMLLFKDFAYYSTTEVERTKFCTKLEYVKFFFKATVCDIVEVSGDY